MEHAVHRGIGETPTAASILESKIFSLSRAEIDACPLGVIQLDANGTVLCYNHAEAELAHYPYAQAIGKNFFTEIAPCTAVREFQGRFAQLIAAGKSACERFSFVFLFAWGNKKVWISMVMREAEPGRVYLVVDAADGAAAGEAT